MAAVRNLCPINNSGNSRLCPSIDLKKGRTPFWSDGLFASLKMTQQVELVNLKLPRSGETEASQQDKTYSTPEHIIECFVQAQI